MENLKDTHIYKKVNGRTAIKEEAFGELTTREIKNEKGEVSIQTYRPLKRNSLLSKAKPVIDANVKAMSINEQVAFMNNIVSPGEKKYTSENIGTEDSQKALKDGYGKYWLDNFAADDIVSTTPFKSKSDDKANKNKLYIQDIEKIQIPRLTRAESLNFDNYLDEGNVTGKAGLIDLDTYSKNLSDAGFLVTKAMSDASGRQMINVTFSREKGKNVTRTIYNDSSEETVNNLLKEIAGATDALNPN